MRADETGLRLGHVAHQFVRRVPGLRLGLAAEDLQPHAEADRLGPAMAGGHLFGTDSLGTAREKDRYTEALARL